MHQATKLYYDSYLCYLGAVILALVYTGIINPKKLIIPAIGVAVVDSLFIIHSSATDVIPELYTEKEAIKLAENSKYLLVTLQKTGKWLVPLSPLYSY